MRPLGNSDGYKVNFSPGEEGRRSRRDSKKFDRKDFEDNFPLDDWTCWTGRTVFRTEGERIFDDDGTEILSYYFNISKDLAPGQNRWKAVLLAIQVHRKKSNLKDSKFEKKT